MKKKESPKVKADPWVGGHYGKRVGFDRDVEQFQEEQVVFISDGAKQNWDIQQKSLIITMH